MALSPSVTVNAQAGALASQSLGVSGTVTYNLDLSGAGHSFPLYAAEPDCGGVNHGLE